MWRLRKHHRSEPPNFSPPSSSSQATELSFPAGQLCHRFTLTQIRSATQNFNESLLIGKGGFGNVYKGTLKNGTITIVALKRWWNFASHKEFQSEIDLLSRLQHHNIVGLVGFCNDGQEMILVYEYMPNRSLKDHLYNLRTPLSWSQRLKICIDVARALEYLHNGRNGQEVIYNNVKTSDILLDNEWAAKITDFRLSKTIPIDDDDDDESDTQISRTFAGTIGYADPEYYRTGRLSKKSDVYSFGVVLLEILCRRRAVDTNLDKEQWGLVEWAQDCMRKGNLEQIIDPELKGQVSVKSLNDYARIVGCCLRRRQEPRITVAEVVFGLESILALHERTANSDKRLQKYFFSSKQNSGGSYSGNDIEILSTESHWHEGDHSDMPKPEVDVISVGSYEFEITRQQSIDFSSEEFEPNHEVNEEEFVFGDETKSLYEYMQLDCIQQADVLTRMKDFLHLIWFYPMKKEAEVNFGSLVDKFSLLNEYIRKSKDSPGDRNYLMEIQAILQDIEEDLDEAAFDMVAYLPEDLVQVPFSSFWSGVPEIHENAVASATNRAISCIKDLKVKKLGISGSGAEQVAERLKEMSELRRDVQIVMTSGSQNDHDLVDMGIRVEDHLLPWILFFTNVDLPTVDNKYTSIHEIAKRLIENCHGHLLAIILLARALKGVVDINVWQLALHELASQKEPSSLGITSDVMMRVLRFVWSHMETLSQRCIMQFASRYTGSEFEKSSLINSWIRDGLVKSEQNGEHAFEDLIRSFLLEQVGDNYVRMRDETRVILLTYFVPRAYGLYLKQDGSESNRMPNVTEWDAREIHLCNNAISELPDNPDCPILVKLFLHFNQDLSDIPIAFFDKMPSLQVLDLSSTSIKCLPSSISNLTSLQKLFIRDCDLLMELPPEIGALKNLKVFDSEGTQLLYLPEQFGSLTKLECLKFSLYSLTDNHKRSNQSMQIIPVANLSKLIRLKELSICVDWYSEWWEDVVRNIINILFKLWNLESLKLYFPTTELLDVFMGRKNQLEVPIYQHLSNFSIIVGHFGQRLISRVPSDLDKTFVKLPKCLKYTNGEGDTTVIVTALKHANALFLDRHWTVRSLSDFGLAEMEKLKFCLLAECNEMVDIVNGCYLDNSSLKPVLGSLELLSVHYMKSLKHIWTGPIHSGCLSNLKSLAMHTCPELLTIFTHGLLESLTCLEYLVVEDCTRINSLVSLDSDHSISTPCLPSLKKISLLDLPELVSISSGLSIAPRLESLVVYNCPKLEKFFYMEVSGDIKEIKGENEWWDALKWTSGQPDHLASVFIPLGTHGDIMDELADAVKILPYLDD